jgi:hypothetical protein
MSIPINVCGVTRTIHLKKKQQRDYLLFFELVFTFFFVFDFGKKKEKRIVYTHIYTLSWNKNCPIVFCVVLLLLNN